MGLGLFGGEQPVGGLLAAKKGRKLFSFLKEYRKNMKKLRRKHENFMKVNYQTCWGHNVKGCLPAANKGTCWIRSELLIMKKKLSLQNYIYLTMVLISIERLYCYGVGKNLFYRK